MSSLRAVAHLLCSPSVTSSRSLRTSPSLSTLRYLASDNALTSTLPNGRANDRVCFLTDPCVPSVPLSRSRVPALLHHALRATSHYPCVFLPAPPPPHARVLSASNRTSHSPDDRTNHCLDLLRDACVSSPGPQFSLRHSAQLILIRAPAGSHRGTVPRGRARKHRRTDGHCAVHVPAQIARPPRRTAPSTALFTCVRPRPPPPCRTPAPITGTVFSPCSTSVLTSLSTGECLSFLLLPLAQLLQLDFSGQIRTRTRAPAASITITRIKSFPCPVFFAVASCSSVPIAAMPVSTALFLVVPLPSLSPPPSRRHVF